MITIKGNAFRLDTGNTSYLFKITSFGHLEHLYYGARLAGYEAASGLSQKRTVPMGCTILYDSSDELYCLDNLYLEWSDIGRGDYRQSPTELKMPDGNFTSDFVYYSHNVLSGSVSIKSLPCAYNADQTLVVTLKDKCHNIFLDLYFTVFEKTDVITRRAVLTNKGDGLLSVRRIMSLSLDLPDEDFRLLTLDGGWIKEAHLHERPVQYGITVNSSTTGNSSSRHNPGFMLAEADATQDTGHVYGFNLVYSGNHYSLVEKSGRDIVRVQTGINPHCFDWNISPGECFETPEAVMTSSERGFNGMSHNMHSFINEHIVRSHWKNRERPVLLNNWEAHFFDFDENRLLELAADAKNLGVELFVLDDGWFGERSSDKSGLGDYWVNPKKFPGGMKAFVQKIKALGLNFGLWFEPEMINPDSDLYRSHPEYAVTIYGRTPAMGRNQLVLDLCRPEVREYIVKNVGALLDEAGIDYVKWDMNRNMAEGCSPVFNNQGEFYHRYIIGLYEVLSRIFGARPHILLESCSSGGNRFDLGMLCFSPQVWSSDDTDPVERLKIQTGLSYLYPPSTMGAHVSQSPNQQTLRRTPLSTRFNTACFGCLGYELDLKRLSQEEKEDIAEQIAFYKQYRKILQYGTFYRIKTYKSNKVVWQSLSQDRTTALTGFFQLLSTAAESDDKLIIADLKAGLYSVKNRPRRLYLKSFGELLMHLLPKEHKSDGSVFGAVEADPAIADCIQEFECSNRALAKGIPLPTQFSGSGYNENVRLYGDFGSDMYIARLKNAET
ncbi:alpha-galactosidase [Ruminiclostridium hungatei]|uniref:Alpha-galactosidase n=1 Tax=Ruminiclostridium hungatei TaxID=48256 RepID=A0A1V4SNG1_RUMHU|nr:alpha-galactosidase [Ruminiclostridium hungatei]OPX45016.1 alpha-galactosidase [Ruminiclostridium hungatei]